MSLPSVKPSAGPDREGSPFPGRRLSESDLASLYRDMAREDAAFVLRERAKMRLARRAERALWILSAALLSGVVAAWVVNRMLAGRVI